MSQPPKLSKEENDALLKRGRVIFAQGAKDLSDKSMTALQHQLEHDNSGRADQLGNTALEKLSGVNAAKAEAQFAVDDAKRLARQHRIAEQGNYHADFANWKIQNIDYIAGVNAYNRQMHTDTTREIVQYRYSQGNAQARYDMAMFDYNASIGISGGRFDLNDEATRRMWAMNQTDAFAEAVKTGIDYAADAALLFSGLGVAGLGTKLAFNGLKSTFRGSLISGYGFGTVSKGLAGVYGGYELANAGLDLANIGLLGRATESIAGFADSAFFAADVGQKIINEASTNKGFTFAVGGTGGAELLGAADGAVGSYFAVDWSDGFDFNTGSYWSGEYGAKPSLLGLESHLGIEATLFTSSDFRAALTGNYSIKGIDTSYGRISPDLGFVKAANGTINGYQFSTTLSTSSSSFDANIYTKYGLGGIFFD